jgi:hypothetical protein
VTTTNSTSPTITSVLLDTSPIGGSSALALVSAGGNVYTNRVTVASATDFYNPIPLQVTVVDALGLTGYASIPIEVGPPPSLTVPNGDMELPAVGAWSTTKPLTWTWRAASGAGDVGLTSTGGANGSQQCLYGNQLAGTLVSPVLSGTFTNTGNAALTYWAKCLNTGYYSITARLLIDGLVVASRPDTLQNGDWTQFTLNYQVTPADLGKGIQVHFSFSGSGVWQGFLDEVMLQLSNSLVFSPTDLVQPETNSICQVSVFLSQAATNTVSVEHFLAGGTAAPGADFNYTPGTLTFAPGVVSNSFSFSVVNNSTYEALKTVAFGLTNASNTMIGTYSTQTVLIVDPEDRPPGTTYFVDSVGGNDSNSGTNIAAPWQSLAKLNATTFQSGDNILLKAGSIWTGQLHPLGSGDYNAQITIDMYGSGAKPVINGGGINGGAFYLLNQEYWSINNLELSNYGSTSNPKKQGILIKNDCVGTLNRIYVRNCYIHDVNGVMDGYIDGKESGGIVFYVTPSNLSVPSKWNDLRIENNVIRDVVREGILLQSLWVNKPQDPNTYWEGCGAYYPSTQVYIASNILERIGGDGIIPWAVNGAVVEYNYVRQSNWNTPGQGHAGLWPYICENIVFQFNEVCETKTAYDGMALDFDNSNQNCIYQYNYSHDNEGGFLNMCCDGNANGNIARYNISQNDGCIPGGRVFLVHGDGNHGYQVYNNTIYVNNANPPVFQQGASSYGSDIAFYNNIIVNMGSGSVSQLGGCAFDYNLFYGNGWIGGDPNKILANPQLVDAGSASNGLASVAGYKLMTNSPALSAGVAVANNGGRDYWGNPVPASTAPNVGAYNGAGFPEIPTVGTNLTWSVNGTDLVLDWPVNYIGWRLWVQTNRLAHGLSADSNDWAVVPGSAATNRVYLPIDSGVPARFYRMSQ